MRKRHGCGMAMAACLVATAAAAQGPIPFELPDDASQSTQVVRMQLGVRDPDYAANPPTTLEIDSVYQHTVNRSQEGGAEQAGRLVMFPMGHEFRPILVPGGLLNASDLDGEGFAPFIVFESPSVTGGPYAPHFLLDGFDFRVTCASAVCNQWLDGPIESVAESGFDHVDGTLDVDAEAVTQDYGVTDDTEDLYHAIRTTASARLGDWIHVTGAGETATVVLVATLPVDLDRPDDDADDIVGLSRWETQGSGDLREILCNDPVEPTVIQSTSFRFDFELTRWSFEEVCEDDGEGGDPVCQEEWVDTPLATQTVSRTREMQTVGCESSLALVPSDTGPLPGSTQLQVEIPTNEWVQLYVTTSTDADCEGAMACDLDARTSAPIQVTIDSPNGALVSWQGVAGLTRAPEPQHAPFAAFGALRWLARHRRHRAAGADVPSGPDASEGAPTPS